MDLIPKKFTINNFDYKVVLELKKKKHSSARVYGDTIVLRVSNRLSKKKQLEHIDFLLTSMKKKLSKRNVKPVPLEIDITERLITHNKIYKTKFIYQQRKSCRLTIEEDNILKFILPDDLNKRTRDKAVKKMVLKALAKDNDDFIRNYTSIINWKYFNKDLKSVKFKVFKSKWGDCSSEKEISINVFLLFCPPEILEYIVIHELAHIDMLNHSKEYWDRVEKILPERKEREEWLRNNGSNILNLNFYYPLPAHLQRVRELYGTI